jgi:hypothetical protein
MARRRVTRISLVLVDLLHFYGSPDGSLVIKFDETQGMNLIGLFPSVIAFRIAFPFDQILQGLLLPPGPVGMYLLHFIFCLSINQIWWWPGEVRPMWSHFSVAHNETSVKNQMNTPLMWEFELNCNR